MDWKKEIKHKEVKQNIFVHAADASTLYHPKVIKVAIKSRSFDPDGMWKGNKLYEIHSDDIKPLIVKWANKHKSDVCVDDLPAVLDMNDRMVFFYNDDDNVPRYRIYNHEKDKWSYDGWYTDKPFVVKFALFSEMKELPLSTKEQEFKNKKDLAKRKVALNNIILKDNILAAFKKAGYPLELYDDEKEFHISEYTHYKAFIEAAIDHYINNVLLKELGCKVHVPKPCKRNGFREPWDSIIDMENIDIIEQ
jgi:hypothetical protein